MSPEQLATFKTYLADIFALPEADITDHQVIQVEGALKEFGWVNPERPHRGHPRFQVLYAGEFVKRCETEAPEHLLKMVDFKRTINRAAGLEDGDEPGTNL